MTEKETKGQEISEHISQTCHLPILLLDNFCMVFCFLNAGLREIANSSKSEAILTNFFKLAKQCDLIRTDNAWISITAWATCLLYLARGSIVLGRRLILGPGCRHRTS